MMGVDEVPAPQSREERGCERVGRMAVEIADGSKGSDTQPPRLAAFP